MREGVTLIELIVTVAVLGILYTLASPTVRLSRTHDAEVLSDMRQRMRAEAVRTGRPVRSVMPDGSVFTALPDGPVLPDTALPNGSLTP